MICILKTETPSQLRKKGGNVELKPVDREFEEWAEAYRQANIDYKDVLKELAK
jgi:hypothetical protein